MSVLPAASELDAADPLAHFRSRFAFPDPELVYLDGNSLGRLPSAAIDRASEVVGREWGDRLIRAWNDAWWEAPLRIGNKLAPLIGAHEGEVVIADSTSVNLFKLTQAALQRSGSRRRIVTDNMNFPSDVYVTGGAVRAMGDRHIVEIVDSADGIHGPADELIDTLGDDVALVTLSHVAFKSGYLYDMGRITAAAHEVGALVLWDLSHSIGAVPIDIEGCGVDLAVGCTYKYLNGGPGSPAFIYVRSELQDTLANPVTGWWGHADPFAFDASWRPRTGMRRFLTGTAPMVSTALIEPGIDVVAEAGVDAIRAKSELQTAYVVDRWRADLADLGFALNTPEDPSRRGSHVALGHAQALGIDLALIADHGVLPDFRPPDNLRLGIAPLYTRFSDLAAAIDALIAIVEAGTHRGRQGRRPAVT